MRIGIGVQALSTAVASLIISFIYVWELTEYYISKVALMEKQTFPQHLNLSKGGLAIHGRKNIETTFLEHPLF